MSEELARAFHEVYERLAPEYGYETRSDTKAFNPDSPNGRLMIAVCAEVAGKRIQQLENAHKENVHQKIRSAWGAPGHRCEWRVAYEAVNQRSKAVLSQKVNNNG